MKGLKDKRTGKFVKNLPSKNCLFCHKDFFPRSTKRQYCSKTCSAKAVTKNKKRQCVWCKKWFSAQSIKTRFCSHRCYGDSGVGTRKGEECHLWKGGITPINSAIRSSSKYKDWVKQILSRDDYTCLVCLRRGRKLHVDHIIPFSAIVEKIKFEQGIENLFVKAMEYTLLWDTNNARTLCIDCHKQTDTYLNRKSREYVI